MDYTARRPMLAIAALTTASALALAPIAVAPPAHSPAAHISTQAVQLTDAWSELGADTVGSLIQIGGILAGTSTTYPLPDPTIFVAPIATQLVLNQLIYLGQLFNGQGAQIPGEISTHLTKVGAIAGDLLTELPDVFVQQFQAPILALEQAISFVAAATNPLIGLVEAPAVFLDFALNSQYGFLGVNGPIVVPLIIRNALAKAIDPPLPGWLAHILQPGKAPASAALKVAAPSHPARAASKKPAASSRARRTAHGKHI